MGDNFFRHAKGIRAFMQLLAGQELDGVIHANQPDNVGGLIQLDIRLAIAGDFSDLPQREAGAAHHFSNALALLLVRLHGQIHHLVNLAQQTFQRTLAGARRAVHALRNVDGDVLEPAKAHAFRMAHHVVVLNGRAQAATGGQRNFVAVENEIDRSVAAGDFAGALINRELLRVTEGFGVDVEVAFGELKDVVVGVAFLPNIQQGAGQLARFFFVVAIGQDALAAGGQISLNGRVIAQAVARIGHLAQHAAAGTVHFREIQLHEAIAVSVFFITNDLFQAADGAIGSPQHVAPGGTHGRHALQIARHPAMNVEIEENGLPAARKRILGRAENQALRHLAHFGRACAAQIRRKHDVDVGQPERAGIISLHRGQKGVQMARQHVGAVRRRALVVEVVQPAQPVFFHVFHGVGRAVHAVGIAEIVQMNRARVVRVFEIGGKNGIKRPLLEHQLGDAQLHGFGVVVDDVAVFKALGIHQPIHVLARNAIHG